MKYLVAYTGTPVARRALELACAHARKMGAFVCVVTSTGGGSGEDPAAIQRVADDLEKARALLEAAGVPCETLQLARGLAAGEDLVQFARENGIDQIYLGLVKKSRTRKLLLGSTAQYVILNGPCPVVTIQ